MKKTFAVIKTSSSPIPFTLKVMQWYVNMEMKLHKWSSHLRWYFILRNQAIGLWQATI